MGRNRRAAAFVLAVFFRPSGAAEVPPVSESKDLTRARMVLEKLAEKHRAAKNVQIKFKSRATGPDGTFTPYWKGILLAADSGRFRLEQNKGVLVSDGAAIRHYAPENKQVVIRTAPATPPSGAVGAAFPNWLGAKPLRAVRNKEGLRVEMEASGAELDSLWVTLDTGKNALRAVETVDAAGNRVEYRIESLRFEVSIGKKNFDFVVPHGVEVVDMR